jgi:hypothetical protein
VESHLRARILERQLLKQRRIVGHFAQRYGAHGSVPVLENDPAADAGIGDACGGLLANGGVGIGGGDAGQQLLIVELGRRAGADFRVLLGGRDRANGRGVRHDVHGRVANRR